MVQRAWGGSGVLLCAAVLLGGVTQARGQDAAAPGQPPLGQPAPHPAAGTTITGTGTPGASSDESLTVLGHHSRFQPAPMPGAPMGPPPDKPAPHLGRYKISGDQTKKDGYDTQTGAYIAPFGTAYTGASPVADGLAPRFAH